MSGFRWGEPYRGIEGSAQRDAERLHEAMRGLCLRMLVLFRRQCRRFGLFRKPPSPEGD